MHLKWLEMLAAWLYPQRDFAWAHNSRTPPRGYVPMGWDTALPWEYADDEELIFYAALIAAAHY